MTEVAESLVQQIRQGAQPGPTREGEALISQIRGGQPSALPSHVGGMSAAAVDGILLGGGDEYLAGLSAAFGLQPDGNGGASWFNYDLPISERYEVALQAIRDEQRAYSQQSPGRAISAEIGGAMLPALLTRNPVAFENAAARVGAGGLFGAAGGAVYGFNEGEGGASERAENALEPALLGLGIGASIPVLGAGFQAFRNSRAMQRGVSQAAENAPTTEQLRRQGSSLYNQIAEAGAVLRPEAVRDMGAHLSSEMMENGLGQTTAGRRLTPQAALFLEALEETIESSRQAGAPLRDLQELRRSAQAVAGTMGNDLERSLGNLAVRSIDSFIENLSPEQLAGGQGQEVAALAREARDVWARMRRSGLIDDAIDRAQNYQSGFESGLRNSFRNLLNNRRAMRGFSDTEIAAMRRVINSRDFNAILRQIGRFGAAMDNGGNVFGLAMGAGAGGVLGGPAGAAAVPVVATAARRLSEQNTVRLANQARGVVANGGSALSLPGPEARNALEHLLRQGAIAGAN